MSNKPICSVYSHYFTITETTPSARRLLNNYISRGLTQMRWMKVPGQRFGRYEEFKKFAIVYREKDYHFSINSLEDMKSYLRNNGLDVEFVYKNLPRKEMVSMKVKKGWMPREYQKPVIAFLSDTSKRTHMCGLATGTGKTFCALSAMSALGMRTIIIVKASYVKKWINDVLEILDINVDDIMSISGSNQMAKLITLAIDGKLDSKIIIISNKTYQNYLKHFQTNRDFNTDVYSCPPTEFFNTLKAGILLLDEVHQDFHLNFSILLQTNIEHVIALSATLVNNDNFLEKMYRLAFPMRDRYKDLNRRKYIAMFPVEFKFRYPDRIRTKEYGSNNYSHIAVEKSIMQNEGTLKRWLRTIKFLINRSFFVNYQQGDKLAIFASSKRLCGILTDYLAIEYSGLDVRRYIAEDPYENIISPDIRVTTILSGGTAIDIPGLTTVILTISIDSAQANIQTKGRLREIPNREVKFYYLYSKQIPKQYQYHQRRIRLLREEVKSIKQIYLSQDI